MIVKNKFNGYAQDGTRRLFKGGSSGPYYANLDRLYAMQAANTEQLMGESQKTFADMDQLRNEAANYGSQANRERAAAASGADSMGAAAAQQMGLEQQMASMGIRPEDMGRNLTKASIANTANMAAGMTGARDTIDKLGFARKQDIASMGLGLPGQATAAANSAANTASTAAQMQMNQAQMNNQATSNAVRGGINLAAFGQNQGWWGAADGGLVPERYARGGIVGAATQVAPPPPPTGAPVPSAGQQAASVAGPMTQMTPTIGRGIQAAGNAMGSNSVASFGAGMADAKGVGDAINAYQTAANQVNAALGTVETAGTAAGAAEAAGVVGGAEAAATAAAGAEAAAGAATAAELGTAATGLSAGATIGAAMPYVGAALLLGSALGLFKDGGHVEKITPGKDGKKGGKVKGPGGPKEDKVPALLSNGEFVLPVGAVKKYGLAHLEQMRQAGLKHEKKLGITA